MSYICYTGSSQLGVVAEVAVTDKNNYCKCGIGIRGVARYLFRGFHIAHAQLTFELCQEEQQVSRGICAAARDNANR